jgi:outer membrane receptor protein involved in Fe transport
MKIFLLLVYFLIFIAKTSRSQFNIDSSKMTETKTIIVKEYEYPEFINKNTTNNRLSIKEVTKIRSEKLIDDLTFLPGIYNVPDGIGGQILNIRGFEQNRVKIYFNGIPLSSNTENRINTEGLFLNNTDISVEKGAASLIYGSNSSGNVLRINNRIITNYKFGIKMNSYFGNQGKQSYNILVKGNFRKEFYYEISTNYFKRKYFILSNNFNSLSSPTSKERLNSDQENLEILTNLTYSFNKNHLLSVTGMYNLSNFGYPPSIINARYRRMDFWNNSILGLRYISKLSKKINLETNLYFTFLSDTLNQYTNNTFTSIQRSSYWNDKTFGVRSIFTYQFIHFNKLCFSVDYKSDSHEQVWFTTATTKANTILSALEYQSTIKKMIFINIGTSYNYTNPSYSSKNENIERKNLSEFNYMLSTAYQPVSLNYKIHAGFSRMSIFPRMRDLFGDVLLPYIPNPNLTTETTDNIDIGFNSKVIHDDLSLQFSGYLSKVQNLLTEIKVSDTTSQVINLQSAQFSGIEIMVKYNHLSNFGLLSYSYLYAKNTSSNRISNFIAYRPKHQLRTFISYEPLKYLGFDLTYSFISERYFYNQNVWQQLPNYSIFDLGITTKPLRLFTIWFKVNNIFDRISYWINL